MLRGPLGCGLATTSVGVTGVSSFELTLMKELWHHQKMNVKENEDGSVRSAGQS